MFRWIKVYNRLRDVEVEGDFSFQKLAWKFFGCNAMVCRASHLGEYEDYCLRLSRRLGKDMLLSIIGTAPDAFGLDKLGKCWKLGFSNTVPVYCFQVLSMRTAQARSVFRR